MTSERVSSRSRSRARTRSVQFRGSARNLEVPTSPLSGACRRHLSSLVVSGVHETLFFIRPFHLHSPFPRFSLFPWSFLLSSPRPLHLVAAVPSSLISSTFSRIFPAHLPSAPVSRRREVGYDESSDLPRRVTLNIPLARRIHYSAEFYNERKREREIALRARQESIA